jgi:hypothetical protein
MKRLFIYGVFVFFTTVLLHSCKTSTIRVTPMGELNMISTRNINKAEDYQSLKTYAGVSSTDVNNALSESKNRLIKKKHRIFKEIMKYKGKTLNEAVDNVVKSQVGGEYLMNARFFLVEISEKKGDNLQESSKFQYVLSGDIWGTKSVNNEIQGFRLDDKVIFTYTRALKKAMNGNKNFEEGEINKQYEGKIVGLSGADATIRLENGSVVDIPYNMLRKIE